MVPSSVGGWRVAVGGHGDTAQTNADLLHSNGLEVQQAPAMERNEDTQICTATS